MPAERRQTLIEHHRHAGAEELQCRADRLAARAATETSARRRARLIEEIQVIGMLQDERAVRPAA